MGAAGSTHGAFARALERDNVQVALNLAKELGALSLDDALDLTAMLAHAGDSRFERAAVRWIGKVAEERELSLKLLAAAVQLVASLPDVDAHRSLRALVRRS